LKLWISLGYVRWGIPTGLPRTRILDAEPLKPFSLGRVDALWEYARATITEEEIVAIAQADSHADEKQMVMGLRMSLAAPLAQFNGDHCPELSGIDGPEFAWRYPRAAHADNLYLRFLGFAIHWSIRVARRFQDRAPYSAEVLDAAKLGVAVGRPAAQALLEYLNAVLPVVSYYKCHVRDLMLLAYFELCVYPDRPVTGMLAHLETMVRKELLKYETKQTELDEAREVFAMGDDGEWDSLLAAIESLPQRNFAERVKQLMSMNALMARVP